MKNYLTNLFNSSVFRHVQRLAVLCLFLSYAIIATASGGGGTKYYHRCQVKIANNSTGRGFVYVSQSKLSNNDCNEKVVLKEDITGEDGNSSNQSKTFYLYSNPIEGYYHSAWVFDEAGNGSNQATSNYSLKIGNIYEWQWTKTDIAATTQNDSETTTFYAVFKEQVAYNDHTEAVVRLVNSNGIPQLDANGDYKQVGGFVNIDANASDLRSVTVNNGKKGVNATSYTKTYNYKAISETNYVFVGWFEADASGNLPMVDGALDISKLYSGDLNCTYSFTTTNKYHTDASKPLPQGTKLYAVFKPSFELYKYNAATDAFYTNALDPQEVTNSVYYYLDNIDDLGEQLYRIASGVSGTITATADAGSDYSVVEQVEIMQGVPVLRATPKNPSSILSGKIFIHVNGTKQAELIISASKEPIYVTLNPAVNLEGTYTYTQNTTAGQVFEVTTSAIVKEMTTATDYSFTFNPTPRDASKFKFEKWVISKPGKADVEYETPNLSHRFEGGESITPVFVPLGGATYIVKSEPNITYTDLQKALDRADALTTSTKQSQIVVVTSKTGKLAQGDYFIRNGVTLLIPGESTYTALLGDLNNDNFGGSSFTTYCTLGVEDNTTITVENGNISIYAKLTKTVAGVKGVAREHGHLALGKNCQITVEKGGLYSFGFITGDESSHITMKGETVTYEPFHMTDWRGGKETIGNWVPNVPLFGGKDGVTARVFPIGQYYIQSIEVPITFEYGAIEKISCCVDASMADATVNMTFIAKYSEECLFGLSSGTTLTKSYDPVTDRLKLEYKGTDTAKKVKVGSMNLALKVSIIDANVNSSDYVMPIQNNMDIDVKNATIDIKYDVAFLPGSTMRVHDDAVINVESKANMYIYDRGARKLNDDLGGYWHASTADLPIVPVNSTFRPGGMKYTRTDADLVDARLIVNGDMNIYGGLYTVKGGHAENDGGLDPLQQGGADITSEGSGKINVYSLGSAKEAKQWKDGSGAQSLALTDPKLLLHNDMSKQPEGNKYAYTSVVNEHDQDLATNPLSYTYYQHDGTWRLPEAGITGIKMYDSQDKMIDSILVTMPTVATVDAYLLATLEPMQNVTYDTTDFNIQLSDGNIKRNGTSSIVNGKLKIPVQYTTQNIHGKATQTLTIMNSSTAEFACDISVPLLAVEDYTPVFEVPSTLTIYARIGESTPGALPIKAESTNVATLIKNLNTGAATTTWNATFTGTTTGYSFALGDSGNELADAKVIYTPENTTTRKCTLALSATYTDKVGMQVTSKVHKVIINGTGLYIDNTLDFENVGTVTVHTSPYTLLKNINSEGKITYEVIGGNSAVVEITKDNASNNSNYTVMPKAEGQVVIRVTQAKTTTHTAKSITTTIVVVADPVVLTDILCLDASNYLSLTADVDSVDYVAPNLKFTAKQSISAWTMQVASMPGVLTFTPSGDGEWAVQESKDGINWTEILWWTQLPDDEQVELALKPTTRKVKISYTRKTQEGNISQLCITPFTLHTEKNKIYVPIKNGQVQPTSIVFTHFDPALTEVVGPAGWTVQTSSDGINKGGVKNTYYCTTVTLSGGENVEELNNGFTLMARQGADEAIVTIGTYEYPKPLPMASKQWISDADDSNNTNGYDESEYYYHYMVDAKNVKWDTRNNQVVFMNAGSKASEEAVRQVVFGYYGLPDVVRFHAASIDWTIEQSETGATWNPVVDSTKTITTLAGLYSIVQPIAKESKYVRITYSGTQQTEVSLYDLVIEGYPEAKPEVMEILIDGKGQVKPLNIYVRNLSDMKLLLDNTNDFEIYHGANKLSNTDILTYAQDIDLAMNEEGEVNLSVKWVGTKLINEATIKVVYPSNNDSVMAIVRVVGMQGLIDYDDLQTGIWTGVPAGYKLESEIFKPYTHHEVRLNNTFASNKALFDYLIIFGETTTIDGDTLIKKPTTSRGSNAKTPLYVYKKKGDFYQYVQSVANTNVSDKAIINNVILRDDTLGTAYIHVDSITPVSVYMTGFCPYASTGYSKNEEGVFLFRGTHGAKLDVYLDSCHIYSRNKTQNGNTFYGDKEGGEIYSDGYARGSGGVLVFENVDKQQLLDKCVPFEVNIHTRGHNLLNSNHGCFFGLAIGDNVAMKAYQVSSPIQVHMYKEEHARTTKTTLNFDDKWPIAVSGAGAISQTTSTNGFLALKKQANNAPSIDLGNQYTEVNFKGGQVELQNSQIGSDTYKTTLAISYRAGYFGADGAGIKLCYGIGTDAVDGTVNFLDGTVTVEKMYVKPAYRQYYLMDTLPGGQEADSTSCLRTPKNTYIKGGSICRVRACKNVTSKGGGPREGIGGRLLGQYVYTISTGDALKANGTYTIQGFPGNISGLEDYVYGLNSVTPDANNKFYFWIPEGFGGVTAEKDVDMATWKACMTMIRAGVPGVAEGEVGGDISIAADEEVKYFLYCQLDENVYNVINAGPTVEGKKTYTYQAPIEVPAAARGEYFKSDYIRLAPNEVGTEWQHQVLSDSAYTITDRAYYITTATADIWQTFAAPFDVENIYVVETFSEEKLAKRGTRAQIMEEQAQHNADFAAFFGVAMAMGTDKSFDEIFDSYIKWAKMMDKDTFLLWDGKVDYTLRGKTKLIPYMYLDSTRTKTNWYDANFYLNHNRSNWDLIEGVDEFGNPEYSFDVAWAMLTQNDTTDGILLHKDSVYSLMFPYCTGCESSLNDRDYWDYWSGKFLIFESTAGAQEIKGRDFLNQTKVDNVFTATRDNSQVVVTGNSTFANMDATDKDIFVYRSYAPNLNNEYFDHVDDIDEERERIVYPTMAFLYGDVPTSPSGAPARRISTSGKIYYDENPDDNGDGTTTGNQGGHIPTVGAGNDLFITETANGINIAVAEAQLVRVLSSTGAVLFSGMVQTAVDVALPANGVYVITGESEVHKILY